MIERYSTPAMNEVWSDQGRYQRWLEVELAACRAMERQGIVPEGTREQILTHVTVDAARVQKIEQRVQHDVIAFLAHLEEQAGEHVRWLHLGLTSSDVLDTAFALQLKAAGQLLLEALDGLREAVAKRAQEFRAVAMVGRTHGIHAEPTTVGLVFAGQYAELKRHRKRLIAAFDDIATGKLSGAVGVYGNVHPDVERQTLDELGLTPEPCATQVVSRDRHAALFSALAQVAATIERMALQVRHWQRTEVSEAREPFGRGQKGSSAMPHKRNPILCENLCGLSRLVRSYAQTALENVALWHERDISHSSVERVIAPDATSLVHFMLGRMTRVVDGMVVDVVQVQKNLERTGGLIFSESVLLALVKKGLERQAAYEMVQRSALAAADGNESFLNLLRADEQVRRHLEPAEIEACFDLQRHLKHVDLIFSRVFAEEGVKEAFDDR